MSGKNNIISQLEAEQMTKEIEKEREMGLIQDEEEEI